MIQFRPKWTGTEEDQRDDVEEKGEMPSLKHPVRTGKKKSGAKKKKSWDSVVKGAQGKGVRNPKAYAAKVFRAQGIDPRTGKKTKKKKQEEDCYKALGNEIQADIALGDSTK